MKIVSTAGKHCTKKVDTLLSEAQVCAADPIHFICNYVKLFDHNTMQLIPLLLSDIQKAYITNLEKHKNVIALHPRRAGVTIATIAYLMWLTTFNRDFKVGIVSPTLPMKNIFSNMIQNIYSSITPSLKPSPINMTGGQFRFSNGSQLIIGDHLSLKSCTLNKLYFADLAVSMPQVQQAAIYRLIPTVVHGGIIINSTPVQKGDMFQQLWEASVANASTFFPFRIHWQDIWPPSTYFNLRQQMGDEVARRQLDCEFI